MNVHTHPALAGFDDMQHRQRRPAPAVMSAGDLAELTREEHRAKFKHTKLCSFYQKGQCTRTFDACAFLHTDDPEVIAKLGGVPANAPNPHSRPANADPHVNPRVNSLTGRPRPRFPPGSRIMGIGVPKRSKFDEGEAPEVETKRTVCRFYASGMCEYGKDCRFLHIVPEPTDRVQASPKANNTLCRNYPGCAYGDRCDFKHVEVNGMRPADSPFSTASALPPSVSARASPAVVSRPLAAEPTPIAPPLSLGERLGLLGERAGSSVVGERTNRKELIRTASFGELPRRETGLLEDRRPSLLDERRSSLLDERRSSLLSSSSLISDIRPSLLSDTRSPLTRGASFNGTEAPSPLARSSSLNLAVDRPNSAFGSLLGLGFNLERAHASQPHTRTHTPIPRAPSPSPTHIGIPPSRIAPHPATVLAPSANGTTNTAPGSGANTPLIRTLPPPGNELSGTGWRVASPLPPHISNEIQSGSVPGSPLALAPGSPLANAFGDGFFAPPATAPAPERKTSGLGLGLGLGLTGLAQDLESDGEGDVLPTMSYEDFADGFTTDHEHDHEHEHEHEEGDQEGEKPGEKPRGYKTLPCKFFNPLLGRDCPAGEECNFIHDQLLSNNSPGVGSESKAQGKESTHPLFRTRECKYWAAGRCNQGDECPFKHTYGDDVEHGLETQSQTQDTRENPYWRTRPCKWFQQGQCLRGDNCNYLHTLESPAPVVCKFYPTPGCRNGSDCPFVHTDEKASEGQSEGSDPGAYTSNGFGNGVFGEGNGMFEPGANGMFETGGNGMYAEPANGMYAESTNGLFAGGNGLYENGLFHGYTYQPQHEDKEEEDSDDDVIFEPMRSAGGVEARSPGGLSMLLSGLALNGHAAAQAQVQAKKAEAQNA